MQVDNKFCALVDIIDNIYPSVHISALVWSEGVFEGTVFLFTLSDWEGNKQMHFFPPKGGMHISPYFTCIDQSQETIERLFRISENI